MPETTIAGRQIRDGAISNAKIAAGANIDTSKLADGANFIKKDGTVAMTGNLDINNQKVVNVGWWWTWSPYLCSDKNSR